MAATHTIHVFNAHPRSVLRRDPIARAVAVVLRSERAPGGDVRVILVSDDALLELNREHLGHDYYTDVITFPIEQDPLEGEIYISVDRAREQARECGVTASEEVRRLAVHGALHLAGYDDASEEQREIMTRLEDRYLAASGNSSSSS
jgi:rRNA maturation RNase YbeY